MGVVSERKVAYVSRCPEGTLELLRELLGDEEPRRRLFLVGTNGPSSFVVKETTEEVEGEGRTHRVLIGSLQSCSCGGVDASQSLLCLHVLFVMVKVLRVPPENPLAWQLSLVDAELESVLAFRHQRDTVRRRHDFLRRRSTDEALAPTGVADDDVCPVCLDDLREGPSTYCASSCGKFCHVRCMLAYAAHHGGSVKCPLCREVWGGEEVVRALRRRLQAAPRSGQKGSETHLVRCSHCRTRPIVGERYRCVDSPVDLCGQCFVDGRHAARRFVKKLRVGGAWEPAPRRRVFADDNEPPPASLGAYLAAGLTMSAPAEPCGMCGGADADALFGCCGMAAHRACVAAAIDAGSLLCTHCAAPIAPGLAKRPVSTLNQSPAESCRARETQRVERDRMLREVAEGEERRLKARLAREHATAAALRTRRALMDRKSLRAGQRRAAAGRDVPDLFVGSVAVQPRARHTLAQAATRVLTTRTPEPRRTTS